MSVSIDPDLYVSERIQQFFLRRTKELTGLLLLATGFVMLVAIASWHYSDPSYSTAATTEAQNLLGDAGAIIADIFMQLFGIASALLPMILICFGWLIFRKFPVSFGWKRAIFLSFALSALCFTLATAYHPSTWPLTIGLGGMWGELLVAPFKALFGEPLPIFLRILCVALGTFCFVLILPQVFGLSIMGALLPHPDDIENSYSQAKSASQPASYQNNPDYEQEIVANPDLVTYYRGAAGHYLRNIPAQFMGRNKRKAYANAYPHGSIDPMINQTEFEDIHEEQYFDESAYHSTPTEPHFYDEDVKLSHNDYAFDQQNRSEAHAKTSHFSLRTMLPQEGRQHQNQPHPKTETKHEVHHQNTQSINRHVAQNQNVQKQHIQSGDNPHLDFVDTLEINYDHDPSWAEQNLYSQPTQANIHYLDRHHQTASHTPAVQNHSQMHALEQNQNLYAHAQPDLYGNVKSYAQEQAPAMAHVQQHNNAASQVRGNMNQGVNQTNPTGYVLYPNGAIGPAHLAPPAMAPYLVPIQHPSAYGLAQPQGGNQPYPQPQAIDLQNQLHQQFANPQPAMPQSEDNQVHNNVASEPVQPQQSQNAVQNPVTQAQPHTQHEKITKVQPQPQAQKPAETPSNATIGAHQLRLEPARIPHDALSLEDYQFPSLAMLQEPIEDGDTQLSESDLHRSASLLEETLGDFGIKGEIMQVRPGPVVTLYELEPAPGTKSSRVIGLSDDIARSMCAISARVAVVPGRNVIGIELPNEHRQTVYLRELLASKSFQETNAKLPLCLGKTIGGESVIADLSRMPHLLIAGTTGSGKSVAVNTMILSLLYRLTPDQCKLIMIDPKMLELSVYDGIPHLLTPVVTDPKKAVVALKWAVREMEERYKNMSKLGVRNIDGYNRRVKDAAAKGEEITRTVQTGFNRETGQAIYEQEVLELEPIPYIVMIVDEMADLMMVAGKEIEGAIQRLAQMARAAGIHLVMATQRPSVDVITGTIKANFPTRISFQVTSKIDSRTILGEQGAENLLGQGDMLYMAGGGRISRVHGPFTSDLEVEDIVAHLKTQGVPEYIENITQDEEDNSDSSGGSVGENGEYTPSGDDVYDQAVAVVLRDGKVSTSYVQRRLGIGYNRAASIVEKMEKEGVISAPNNAGKREILVPHGNQ